MAAGGFVLVHATRKVWNDLLLSSEYQIKGKGANI